jgi:4-carboxymuconolactone decarboxylase
MTRLRPITRDELTDEQARLWDGITANRGAGIESTDAAGGLIGPFNAFVHVPEVGRRLTALGGYLRFDSSIERRLTEVAICTVGAHWRSEFEFWAHAPMALEHGVSATVVDALREGRRPEFEREDERIVHAVTSKLLVERRVDDETYAAAAALLGDRGMVELAALVGYYCLVSMTLNLFEVPLPAGEQPIWG